MTPVWLTPAAQSLTSSCDRDSGRLQGSAPAAGGDPSGRIPLLRVLLANKPQYRNIGLPRTWRTFGRYSATS
jgi:hypothetical protein